MKDNNHISNNINFPEIEKKRVRSPDWATLIIFTPTNRNNCILHYISFPVPERMEYLVGPWMWVCLLVSAINLPTMCTLGFKMFNSLEHELTVKGLSDRYLHATKSLTFVFNACKMLNHQINMCFCFSKSQIWHLERKFFNAT